MHTLVPVLMLTVHSVSSITLSMKLPCAASRIFVALLRAVCCLDISDAESARDAPSVALLRSPNPVVAESGRAIDSELLIEEALRRRNQEDDDAVQVLTSRWAAGEFRRWALRMLALCPSFLALSPSSPSSPPSLPFHSLLCV